MNNSVADISYYDITPNQQIIYLQQKFALNKAVSNIPMAVTFNQPLDFALLRQAIQIEIERNDCLRLRFTERDDKLVQYFQPQMTLPEIKYLDFRDKTPQHQRNYLQKTAAKTIPFKKGESWQFILFTDTDGRDGLFFKQHHLANDAGGIFIMINDLMQVYTALATGGELPKPMGSFEQRIIKDLANAANEMLNERDKKYFTEYYLQDGPLIYTAPYGMQTLNDYRRKKKDPTLRACPAFALLNTHSIQVHFDYDEARTRKLEEYCAANDISVQALYYFLIHTQSSLMNEGEPDVSYNLTNGNRGTLTDKRTSGMMLNSYVMRTVLPQELSAYKALRIIRKTLTEFYHHNVLSGIYVLNIIEKLYPKARGTGYYPGTISYIPYTMQLPDDWTFEVEWISPQILASPLFFGLLHDQRHHVLHFYFEYLNSFCSSDAIDKMYRNFCTMLDCIMEDLNISLKDLMEQLEK